MGQTQTIAQTLPEPFDVGIGFTLPEDAVITPTAQGCAASIDYSRLCLFNFADDDQVAEPGDTDVCFDLLTGEPIQPVRVELPAGGFVWLSRDYLG